jgi:hypothetical protein
MGKRGAYCRRSRQDQPRQDFGIYKEIYDNAYGMHFTFVGKLDGENVKHYLKNTWAHYLLKKKKLATKTMVYG